MKPPHRVLAALVATVVLMLGAAGIASAFAPGSGTISGITPAAGPTAGGTTITIEGTQLAYGDYGLTVTVGGVEATGVSWQSPERISAVTPAGAAGPADVVVNAYGYESARSTGGFTYVAPGPAIGVTGVTPASGLTTGGEAISITGSGFSGGSTPSVTIGGAAATSVTVVSDTVITATTPEHAAGPVDVSVSRDGGTGTKASAYEYRQGHWLIITNSQPPGTGPSSDVSTGAVRSTAFGDWKPVQVSRQGFLFTLTSHTGYAGGINCGNRVVRSSLFTRFIGSETNWAGGACRYAFPAGTSVALSALPSSSTGWDLLATHYVGLFNRWTGACTGTAVNCTVAMTADRATGAAWGRTAFSLFRGTSVAVPQFAPDGSLSYAVLSTSIRWSGSSGSGAPTFTMVSTFTVGGPAASEHAARRVVACRAPARMSGTRRLESGCTPTAELAAALRKGPVRLSTRWYMRVARQKATYPIGQTQVVVRNRPAVTPVTG